ncbi:MAG: AbrB/MazE/SpoVT family DNA-binding domain-containing protein [Methanosarcinales archaeon]
MTITKVNKDFQITLPRDVRELLHLKIGDKLDIIPYEDRVILKKLDKKRLLKECAGCWTDFPEDLSSAEYVEIIRSESEKRMKRLGI